MSIDLPFPVRLADMKAAEDRYAAASDDEKRAMNGALTFYDLLTIGERAALERRFPEQLTEEPTRPTAEPELRQLWDTHSRNLVLRMLEFGNEVLARHMDLVGNVAIDGHGAVLALTSTGSIIELGPPDSDNLRAYHYRPSPRADRGPEDGTVTLTEPVHLGDRMYLGGKATSEVIVLAAGLGAIS
jgi:hypothetical protein